MGPLSARDVVSLWETGRRQHPLDRALSLLCACTSETAPGPLRQMTIGQRDRRLLDLFESNFGRQLKCQGICPSCGQCLEYTMSVSDLRLPPATSPFNDGDAYQLTAGEIMIRFRLPNSDDLAAVANAPPSGRRLQLIERCVLEARIKGTSVCVAGLPEGVIDVLTTRMAQCDPQADLLIAFHCPKCEGEWQVSFDIASFLWRKLSARAKRLLEQVHILATAYKWQESDILSMSSARRQYYLGRVTS